MTTTDVQTFSTVLRFRVLGQYTALCMYRLPTGRSRTEQDVPHTVALIRPTSSGILEFQMPDGSTATVSPNLDTSGNPYVTKVLGTEWTVLLEDGAQLAPGARSGDQIKYRVDDINVAASEVLRGHRQSNRSGSLNFVPGPQDDQPRGSFPHVDLDVTDGIHPAAKGMLLPVTLSVWTGDPLKPDRTEARLLVTNFGGSTAHYLRGEYTQEELDRLAGPWVYARPEYEVFTIGQNSDHNIDGPTASKVRLTYKGSNPALLLGDFWYVTGFLMSPKAKVPTEWSVYEPEWRSHFGYSGQVTVTPHGQTKVSYGRGVFPQPFASRHTTEAWIALPDAAPVTVGFSLKLSEDKVWGRSDYMAYDDLHLTVGGETRPMQDAKGQKWLSSVYVPRLDGEGGVVLRVQVDPPSRHQVQTELRPRIEVRTAALLTSLDIPSMSLKLDWAAIRFAEDADFEPLGQLPANRGHDRAWSVQHLLSNVSSGWDARMHPVVPELLEVTCGGSLIYAKVQFDDMGLFYTCRVRDDQSRSVELVSLDTRLWYIVPATQVRGRMHTVKGLGSNDLTPREVEALVAMNTPRTDVPLRLIEASGLAAWVEVDGQRQSVSLLGSLAKTDGPSDKRVLWLLVDTRYDDGTPGPVVNIPVTATGPAPDAYTRLKDDQGRTLYVAGVTSRFDPSLVAATDASSYRRDPEDSFVHAYHLSAALHTRNRPELDCMAATALLESWHLLWPAAIRKHDLQEPGEVNEYVLADASVLRISRQGQYIRITAHLTRWHDDLPAVSYQWLPGDQAASAVPPRYQVSHAQPVDLAVVTISPSLAKWCIGRWADPESRTIARSLLAEVHGLHAWVGERNDEGEVTVLLTQPLGDTGLPGLI